MCLKKILMPNNKDGDSCCFKSSATQRLRSPKREGKLAFQHTEADFIGLYGRIKYNMGED